MRNGNTSRRLFLRGAGAGAALLLGSTLNPLDGRGLRPVTAAASGLGRSAATRGRAVQAVMPDTWPDTVVDLTALKKTVQILPGTQTNVWGYEGFLVSGSGATISPVPGSYLGPILRVKRGTKLRILFHNQLGEDSVVHPHGLRVPQDCDGSPMQAIPSGATKTYDFEVLDRPGPYWFHPHPHMRTAEQVLMGLAGLFYVWDPVVTTVPGDDQGTHDVPVVIQDRTFDSNNQFVYNPNQMWGYLADRILVNGKPNAAISLEPRAYRLRVVNGSNARTYKLAWSSSLVPLKVIGTDGGLLPAPVTRSYVMLMPGERVDLWADFGNRKLRGTQVVLRSLSFDPGGMGGMGGGGGGMGGGGMGGGGMGGGGMGTSLPMGSAFDILKVNVGTTTTANPTLGTFAPLEVRYTASDPRFASARPFTLEMSQMVWTINHRVYDMTAVADDEMVNLGDTMAWEWINNSPIPHPMHIHNIQFQVIQRTPSSASSYATVNQGFVDSGWKDTVLVWPGERVKVAMQFSPYSGMYMYHCHILEHEDMTMMRNYMIMDPMAPM